MIRLPHLARFKFFSSSARRGMSNTAYSALQKENPNRTQMRKLWRLRRVRLQNDQGFTLVELLVTMIVISILSLTLANFIVTWLQAASLSQARTDLLATAQQALDTVTNDIRLSGSADSNNRWPDTYGPSGQFSWQSSDQVLVLAKAATDSQNNIIFSDPLKYITQKDNEIYFRSGTTLYRRTLASTDANDEATTTCPEANATADCPADKVVATGVSNFSVTYYDADGQTVTSITIEKMVNSKTIDASYDTRMVFRNE
jgi:prepilin-type N-terminal cleavage/methylation domain-containing protein